MSKTKLRRSRFKEVRNLYKPETCTDMEWVNNRFQKPGSIMIKKSGRIKILHIQDERFYTIWFCNFILLIRHLFRGY